MGGTVADSRAGVADRRAGLDRRGVHDRCRQTGRMVQLHGPGGIDADQSRPDADHAEMCRRVGHRPDVAARWASGEPSPAARTACCAACIRATAGAFAVVGPVGQRKMPHDTHDADPPSLLTTPSETDQFVPLAAGAAATGHPGVHM
jgi:hypothetical protein